jgi:hypothetical protein
VLGRDQSVLGGALAFDTTATQQSPVGSYEVTPKGLSSNNYNIDLVKGTLTIQYGWRGFLRPINDTAHQTGVAESEFKLEQTMPVKFDLYNAAGNTVQQATNQTFTKSNNLGSCDASTTLEDPTTLSADAAATYAYTGGHYQYNWSTKSIT